jgi:hypothetical protein
MEDQILKYEDLPKLKKQFRDSGVTTESQNRLPIFEPSLKPREGTRRFEGKYGKMLVEGRLGQAHKNLLEAIFWKKEIHSFIEINGKKHLKVLYDEMKIRKYLSQKSDYSYGRYRELLKDMIRTYIQLKTEKLEIEGTLIMEIEKSEILKPTKSKSPLIPEQVPLKAITFGAVATALFEDELRFTYDPKPIMELKSGISQAVVRFLKTQKNHPPAGYHLKELIKNLVENAEGQKWKNIRRFLKEDTEQLESLGIIINFKEDRLSVINNKIML